jgi:TetR/AcrR family transcriptional regulator
VRVLPDGIARRQAVLAETFAAKGFDETRMEDLAEAAGIPKATLYYHFAGKEEILAWLLRSTLADLGEAVAKAAEGSGSARRRLEGVVRAQLRVMAERPAACRILIADLGRAGRMPDIADGVGRAFHDPVLRLLAEGAADGSWPKVKGAETVASAIFGAVVIPALDQLVRSGSLDPGRLARPVLHLVFSGVEGP